MKGQAKTYGNLTTEARTMPGPQDPPTPTAGDASCVTSRVLNPQFVEMLMGFPAGWTDCMPLATPSCPSKPLEPSASSPRDCAGGCEVA